MTDITTPAQMREALDAALAAYRATKEPSE